MENKLGQPSHLDKIRIHQESQAQSSLDCEVLAKGLLLIIQASGVPETLSNIYALVLRNLQEIRAELRFSS
jgi:hypothetical protein